NEEIAASIHRRNQFDPKVLVLYWDGGDPGFKDECDAVRKLFEEVFNYPTEEFAIPSKNSQGALSYHIAGVLLDRSPNSTLIIYYGGHAGLDNNIDRGQKCQSVWAKGPTLKWYRIQEQMRDSPADILLILDCCYAAQAARGADDRVGRFEILAASARATPTPGPGIGSFTNILLNKIRQDVAENGSWNIKEMHGQLCMQFKDGETEPIVTPVHIVLEGGHSSMVLKPLAASLQSHSGERDVGGQILHVLVRVGGNCTKEEVEEVGKWLSSDIPPAIAHMEVCDTLMELPDEYDSSD
ncbi:hypothetical protein PG993_012884, partial [Apiospora rasikravindrae]